jgi:fatty-acyl-CoA synthase
MKFVFNAGSFPKWDREAIFAKAADLGYQAVEADYSSAFAQGLFTPEAEKDLKKRDLVFSALLSPCVFEGTDSFEKNLEILKECLIPARAFNIPYIKIRGDSADEPGGDVEIAYVAENLRELSEFMEKETVSLLIESNGVFSDSFLLKDVLDIISRDKIGVCWNVYNTYNFCLEPLPESYSMLKRHLRYVCAADSPPKDGAGGKNDSELFSLLKTNGFKGFVSFSPLVFGENLLDLNK